MLVFNLYNKLNTCVNAVNHWCLAWKKRALHEHLFQNFCLKLLSYIFAVYTFRCDCIIFDSLDTGVKSLNSADKCSEKHKITQNYVSQVWLIRKYISHKLCKVSKTCLKLNCLVDLDVRPSFEHFACIHFL